MSSVNTFGTALFGDLLPVNILSVTEDQYLPQIQAYIAREEAFLAQLTAVLCDQGTEVQTGFSNGPGGQFQKLSRVGNVEATVSGAPWYVGFPIFAYGNKQIYEFDWLQDATFWQLAETILDATLKDIHTTIVNMISALLNNANSSFNEGQWPAMKAGLPGTTGFQVAVKALANNDGATGSVYARGKEVPIGTLQSYLTYGTLVRAAFDQNRAFLSNLGNDEDVVHVASKATCDSVASTFTAGSDFIIPVEILDTTIAQDFTGKYALRGKQGIYDPGIRHRGRIGGAGNGDLVEWPHFPDNYIYSFDRSKQPPLRRRISQRANEQGLILAKENNNIPDVQNNPFVGKSWRRIQGFGVRNRANGVVTQITGGSYSVPTIV